MVNRANFLKACIMRVLARQTLASCTDNELTYRVVSNIESGNALETGISEAEVNSEDFAKLEECAEWAEQAVEIGEHNLELILNEGQKVFSDFIQMIEWDDPLIFHDISVYASEEEVLEYWYELWEVPDHLQRFIDKYLALNSLTRDGSIIEFGSLYVYAP